MQAAAAGPQIALAGKSKSGLRLPKPAVLVATTGIGALAIAYAILGLELLRGPQEYQEVESGIANANIVINKTQTSTDELVPALQQAEGQLAAIQGAFPNRVQTTPFLDGLFQLADRYTISLTNTQNRRSREQTIGQHKYVLAPFTITAEGDVPNLVAFLGAVEKMAGYTLVVRTAQLSKGTARASLIIEAEIYTRAPAAPEPAVPTATPKIAKPAR